ncbi:DUF4276 family protein [Aeromonas caviae]|uniref:DUF4276 family protein n=1 Tax=Aeromonas TaxID=642 RepID=UPI001C5A63F6|nr:MULTISPECIES: DUF4276 family protein [Aeromonas]MBW3782083.1 DUF4276 family protein [Aeromonas veronii]GJA84638.1 hypothetical protein KAM356_06970 [Aeromonas caviae]GJA88672.1 hypothetical protein KAM357_06200 [Aeromonas caviae]GJB05984.1 hypothetical protein KAM361_06570 [Aeromonas caviae]GJB14526.1 hypothetical protein KAM363_05310 [Aeromonas caviae]
MTTLVFCLEEPSAKAMLEGVVPRLFPDVQCHYMVFEGKQDLHKRLVMRLRHWQGDALFVVMRDQDSGNCIEIKGQLATLCEQAGRPNALVRIACCELESFYLGDLAAVEQGLQIAGLARQQANQKFRDPDRLVNAAEELKKITRNSYQKLSGSRSIAPYLRLDEGHRSTSFKALLTGLQRIMHRG